MAICDKINPGNYTMLLYHYLMVKAMLAQKQAVTNICRVINSGKENNEEGYSHNILV